MDFHIEIQDFPAEMIIYEIMPVFFRIENIVAIGIDRPYCVTVFLKLFPDKGTGIRLVDDP
ncbi:hypothetical protein RAA17_13490 [Komagataeibacter rhaeticus]|nr:hypothetical protein [Komagataeibacter rhaeticus]